MVIKYHVTWPSDKRVGLKVEKIENYGHKQPSGYVKKKGN